MYLTAKNVELKQSGATQNWVATTGAGTLRTGSTKNDIFHSLSGDVLSGGAGDDTYYLWDAKSSVVESAGGGIDTVQFRAWGGYKLGANIENLVLGGAGATWGTGNDLNNIITAGTAGATLDGGKGDDVLVGGTGADVFKIAAGNGSDAIVNFTPGWDRVSLNGYNITSFAQLTSQSQQVGADVKVTLSATESVVLRGVKLASLSAADFGLATTTAVGAAPAGTTVLTGAGAAWNSKGWYVLNNSYNMDGLTWGKDASIRSEFKLGDMTHGTKFNWDYPAVTDAFATIRAYPEIIFGISPLNPAGFNPTDTAKVLPAKVGDLDHLTAKHDLNFSGTLSGFNVAYDIWLTSKPGGDRTTITNEVMVWVHKGAFPPFGEQVGNYTAPDGQTAKIFHTGTYTAVVFDNGLPKADIDVSGIMAKLVDLGIVSKSEYIGSIELGAEVVSGQGSLTFNDFSLDVTTRNPDGSLTTKIVGSTGTTVTTVAASPPKTEFTAGSEALFDQFGQPAGKEVTSIEADGTIKKALYSEAGKLLGTDLVTLTKSGHLVSHYDAAGTLTGMDKKIVGTDGSVTMQTMNIHGAVLSAERTVVGSDGWTLVQHYDRGVTLTGMERTITKGNVTSVSHYDATSKFLGADQITKLADGSVRTISYDAKWATTGIDVLKVSGTTATTTHYDGALKVLSYDVVKANPEGDITFHYDAAWKLKTMEYDRTSASGIVTHFTADGSKVLSAVQTGTSGSDVLTGSYAVNHLHGGLGSDRIAAGAGIDHIHFDTAVGQGDVDSVTGFKAGQDKIVLDHQVFDKLGAIGALSAGAFVTGTAAATADTRLIFDKTKGELWYDADGTGAGAAKLVAKLGVTGTLSAADFSIG